MGERSALDRLAIASIVIAGVVEAGQAALSQAPAVTKAYPVLKLDGIWNYAPLFFITLATLLWVADWALRIFRPSYAQARAAPQSAPVPRAGWKIPWGAVRTSAAALLAICVAALGVFGLSRCAAAREQEIVSRPEMKFAPVLRGAVTLAFVRQTLQSQDSITAEKTLSSFLGTTMRVSGMIHQVEDEADYSRLMRMTDEKATPQVYLLFAGSQSSAVKPYSEGQHIAAECKVERLDAAGVGLDGCVVIPDEAWTGKPAAS